MLDVDRFASSSSEVLEGCDAATKKDEAMESIYEPLKNIDKTREA